MEIIYKLTIFLNLKQYKFKIENQWFRIPEDIFIRNTLNNPFKPKPLGTAFNRANKRAGFKKLDNTTAIPKIDYIRLHILRKIFASTLGKE